MTMDLSTLQRFYAACRDEALAPDDPRNVDIDSAPGCPRGERWIERLAEPIWLEPKKPAKLFFTGLPGSGKSTELRRLVARLADPELKLLAVLVDAETELDLTHELDVPDLLAVLIHKVERAVLTAEGRDPDDALRDGYLTRLRVWLANTGLALNEVGVSVGADGPVKAELSLTAEMKTKPDFRKEVRGRIANHLATFLADARKALLALHERAIAAGYGGICAIFDSLEKLRGTSENWNAVLHSAERVFSGGAPYLDVPIHVIFTLPAALFLRLRGVQVDFMPVVKLRHKDGSPAPAGKAAVRSLIRKRLPDDVLQEMLGPTFENHVDEILEQSGGYPREVVFALQYLLECYASVLRYGSGLPPERQLKRRFNEIVERFRVCVYKEDYAWLRAVAAGKALVANNDEHCSTVGRALTNNVVLKYVNDDHWWDLHPAVRAFVMATNGETPR
jgi:hypothetical protein